MALDETYSEIVSARDYSASMEQFYREAWRRENTTATDETLRHYVKQIQYFRQRVARFTTALEVIEEYS